MIGGSRPRRLFALRARVASIARVGLLAGVASLAGVALLGASPASTLARLPACLPAGPAGGRVLPEGGSCRREGPAGGRVLRGGCPHGCPRPADASSASAGGSEAAELSRDDRGLYVAFCPPGEAPATVASRRPRGSVASSRPRASVAMASHAGWPPDECLKMDKGPVGLSHTLVGLQHVHNWLLGGYGNDTFYAGERGDVIWGDYHPEGQPESQRDYIHGGAGADWIYSSHGYNEIWTGGGDDHLALVYGHGIVYCNGPGVKTFVMRYLPQNRPWKLVGCSHKALDRYRA